MCGFENGGHHVDEMGELGADAALVLDARGPGDDHEVAGATEVGRDLFHPLERCVAGPSPADRLMRLRVGIADRVEVLQVVLERSWKTVEGLDFIERAVGQLIDGVDQAGALLIGEG